MESVIVVNSSRWRWRWEDICGPDGFKIWSAERHDLGHCFQQLCLQIPAFSLLAIASSYYFGRRFGFVRRGVEQIVAINLRCFIILFSSLFPVLQIYIYLNKTDIIIYPVSYFLFAVEGLAWLVHLGYTLVLRKRLGMSPRGPVFICVMWTLLFMLDILSMRTNLLIYKHTQKVDFGIYVSYAFSICSVILQVMYGLTLLPGEGNTTCVDVTERTQQDERTSLLGHSVFDRFLEEQDPTDLGAAMEGSSWLSKLLFYWVNPLMEKGVQGKLRDPDDLFDLPESLSSTTLSQKLDKALIGNIDEIQRRVIQKRLQEPTTSDTPDVAFNNTRKYNVSLLRALHKCFWFQFYSVGVLKLVADCAGFAGPLLLNKLVAFIENGNEEMSYGYTYACGLFFTTVIVAFCSSHFNFLMSVVGLKIRAAVVTAIYRKTLSVSSTTLNSAFSVGEIVNFMSTDTDRIVNSCPSFHAFWSIPLQVGVTLYLLYLQVGLAFLAGLAFSIVLIPINKFIANKIGELSTKMMERKDARVKMMTEILRGIKIIKIHVWEQHFVKLVLKMREGELKYLKGRKYLDALCVYFWATTPVLISILTFGSYVLMGKTLTAATVFTSMALMNMLISPLNAFPWVLNGLTEAWVSLQRIQRFLDLPDLHFDIYYKLTHDDSVELKITNGGFKWAKSLTPAEREAIHAKAQKHDRKGKSKTSEKLHDVTDLDTAYIFSLRDVSLTVKKGEFIGITGRVGSGKSTLLAAILAELSKEWGDVEIRDLDKGFGYVSQQPWIQRGTIRDNIVFGRTFDETRYKTVLKVCGLAEDILLLPAGDLTGVGEAGMTLSGGQKARVALARAVYQDKPVYLLDDILAAVDARVAKHIFQQCIMGFLKSKTRILCTHYEAYLVHADTVLYMENGKVTMQGKPADIIRNIDDSLPLDIELGETNSGPSSLQSMEVLESLQTETTTEEVDSLLNQEFAETGTVQFSVYNSYFKAVGFLLASAILLSLILMQTSRNMSDWWLSYWVTATGNTSNSTNVTFGGGDYVVLRYYSMFDVQTSDPIKYYLATYGIFVGLNSLFTLFRAFLFAYGGITAASKIHKMLLKSIIKAKSVFFDVSPLGRILNRFSSDTYTADDSLPFILNILLAQTFGLIGSVIVTIYGLPWLCLVLVPLIPVYHWLQHHYRLTSRELKRLSSTTLSPVYSHFNESLQGLVTIRALRATNRFRRDNEENVEINLKAQFASQAAGQWLGLRLQFIGVSMVAGVCFIAVVQHQYDVADPGLVGLAITYALSITGLLSGVINAFTETEREMIAVERINQYIEDVIPETADFLMDPPFAWPCHGVVSFNNVVLRYREHVAPSLKGVTFETRPAEKIGVVGRTGAGKSSLLNALFRLVEISAGSISIDSVNIAYIAIPVLRSRLWCIPQDPFLFSGTMRDNVDPLGEFKDEEVFNALCTVKMVDGARADRSVLDSEIASAGSNLSAGQKQLICLARAMLHNAKIICIDEATASVDQRTDELIQCALRSVFRKSTVIIIAHRVPTVLDCDRIMVMGDGQLLEFDTPENLLNDSTSHFYHLANQDN